MELLNLADRIERYQPSSVGDICRDAERELNESIAAAVGIKATVKVGHPALGNERMVPARLPDFVNSLDAAMTLVPEGMVVLITNTGISGFGADLTQATAAVGFPNEPENAPSQCRTMALALTAAALRAQASSLKENDSGR